MTAATLQEQPQPYRERVHLARRERLLSWLEGRDWTSGRVLVRWFALAKVHRNTVCALLGELVEEGLVERRLTVASDGQGEFRLPGGPPPVSQLAPASSPFQLVFDALAADPERSWSLTELAAAVRCKSRTVQLCLHRLRREGQVEGEGWRARERP